MARQFLDYWRFFYFKKLPALFECDKMMGCFVNQLLFMRVWDIHPKHLCRKHLLGEHRELHGLWNILTKHRGTGGYSQHPETLRWVGKQKALYERHEALVREFSRRGYQHHTPLDKRLARGNGGQKVFINTIREQKVLLKNKPCQCFEHTSL